MHVARQRKRQAVTSLSDRQANGTLGICIPCLQFARISRRIANSLDYELLTSNRDGFREGKYARPDGVRHARWLRRSTLIVIQKCPLLTVRHICIPCTPMGHGLFPQRPTPLPHIPIRLCSFSKRWRVIGRDVHCRRHCCHQ